MVDANKMEINMDVLGFLLCFLVLVVSGIYIGVNYFKQRPLDPVVLLDPPSVRLKKYCSHVLLVLLRSSSSEEYDASVPLRSYLEDIGMDCTVADTEPGHEANMSMAIQGAHKGTLIVKGSYVCEDGRVTFCLDLHLDSEAPFASIYSHPDQEDTEGVYSLHSVDYAMHFFAVICEKVEAHHALVEQGSARVEPLSSQEPVTA
jgi:hypothetical protein